MNILSALAADSNLAPAFRAAIAPKQHAAATGWRRMFLSAIDARQYEAGYGQWPEPMPTTAALSTPYSAGWFDAEADERFRVEDRRAEHVDRKENDE